MKKKLLFFAFICLQPLIMNSMKQEKVILFEDYESGPLQSNRIVELNLLDTKIKLNKNKLDKDIEKTNQALNEIKEALSKLKDTKNDWFVSVATEAYKNQIRSTIEYLLKKDRKEKKLSSELKNNLEKIIQEIK